MGIFDRFTGRKAGETETVAGTENSHGKTEVATNYVSGSDSDLDLVDRNEKEILEHPDEVTVDAQPGVQKAEAVALVWSKTSLYIIYAW